MYCDGLLNTNRHTCLAPATPASRLSAHGTCPLQLLSWERLSLSNGSLLLACTCPTDIPLAYTAAYSPFASPQDVHGSLVLLKRRLSTMVHERHSLWDVVRVERELEVIDDKR